VLSQLRETRALARHGEKAIDRGAQFILFWPRFLDQSSSRSQDAGNDLTNLLRTKGRCCSLFIHKPVLRPFGANFKRREKHDGSFDAARSPAFQACKAELLSPR